MTAENLTPQDLASLEVLLIYGYDPKTTAVYVHRALKRLVKRVETIGGVKDDADWGHSLGNDPMPNVADAVSRMGGCDVALWVESPGVGPLDGISVTDVPVGMWAIDSHFGNGWRRHAVAARSVSLTFVAQLPYLSAVSQARSAVTWVPLAAEPSDLSEYAGPPEHDVAFIGSVDPERYPRRTALLAEIKRRGLSVTATSAEPREMFRIYRSARVGFNCSLASELNMRFFEVMASGRPLLTDRSLASGQDLLFSEGLHYAAYGDDGECYSKLERILAEEETRETMGAAGKEAILEGHTYEHRVRRMLSMLMSLPSPRRLKLRDISKVGLYLGDRYGLGLRKESVP